MKYNNVFNKLLSWINSLKIDWLIYWLYEKLVAHIE